MSGMKTLTAITQSSLLRLYPFMEAANCLASEHHQTQHRSYMNEWAPLLHIFNQDPVDQTPLSFPCCVLYCHEQQL